MIGVIAFTLTVTILAQDVANVYEITEVPVVIPVSIPVVVIVATEVVDELHVPPPGAELNVTVDPLHIVVTPTIGEGSAFTVTYLNALHPALKA